MFWEHLDKNNNFLFESNLWDLPPALGVGAQVVLTLPQAGGSNTINDLTVVF